MQSMTVRTRLRSADRPATCGAARGTGINVSSSTTNSTAAAGKRDALAGDGHDQQKLVHLPLPAARRLERHQQPGAVVTIDAFVLLAGRFGLGREARSSAAGIVGHFRRLAQAMTRSASSSSVSPTTR